MNSLLKYSSMGSRGVVLTVEALDILKQALQTWWDNSEEKTHSKTGKLTRPGKAEGMGLEVKTVDRIFRRESVDVITLQSAFDRLRIKPAFSVERYCATVPSGNLERLSASSIPRETDVAAIKTLLESNYLVTLTGSGGVGKTWLAQRVGKELECYFADSVWLVELEGLPTGADESLLLQKIATVLTIHEESNRSLIQTVSAFLRERQLLLIMDNCEHVLDTVATLTRTLLKSSTALRVLATSRELLDIDDERCYLVPSLSVPDVKRFSKATEDIATLLLGYDAVRLFVERARKPGFELTVTEQNASVLARICQRLDGIPLALELAAARVRTLSLNELEAGLNNCFPILIGGNKFTPSRQRSLQATLDWSYNLLTAPEQTLLHRLSVFAGGCSREATEQVCAIPTENGKPEIDGQEVLDILTSLIDKNLLACREEHGKARYYLLETVRQYGEERLVSRGESDTVRRRHRDYFLMLAEQAEPELSGAKPSEWLQRLESEHENLRAGLEWSFSQGETRESLRFVGALAVFWRKRGYLSEGRKWCAKVLDRTDAQEVTRERAIALYASGDLARYQSDYVVARPCYEESLAFWRTMGDRDRILHLLNRLGDVATVQRDFVKARTYLEESLAICQEIGDRRGQAVVLRYLGALFSYEGDTNGTIACFQESLAICQESRDWRGTVHALHGLADAAIHQGDYTAAGSYFAQVLSLYQEFGSQGNIALALRNMGGIA